MATKKKGKKKTKKVSKKASAKRTSSKKKGAKKKARSSEVEGVTLAELAEEADVSPQKARQKLREAGIEREKGSRWAFPEKSKALKAARKALGL